jgi:RNA methyltransferase, TrmH family
MARHAIMNGMDAERRSPDLTSTANPRVKSVAGLRDRRERDRTGLTVVDGAREVRRALEAGAPVEEAFVCIPLLQGEDARVALDRLEERAIPVSTTSPTVFEKLAFGERAEGILAVVRIPSTSLHELQLPPEPLVVVLEGVEKPGNLGAVLRSADGAGADALILASGRTDPFNPNVIRASAGTAFSVPLAAAPTDEVVVWLRERGVRIVAARVNAGIDYSGADLRGPVAIALGSEAAGLTTAWSVDGIEPVSLPMLGVADSLNVSVTAAVLLYEARRQRGRSGPAV